MDGLNRLSKWDNAKAVIIFFVVFGHFRLFFSQPSMIMSCGYLWENIFNMPSFIFIAGLFSKNKINHRRFTGIVPYLFLYLIMKALEFFASVFSHGGMDNVSFEFFYEDSIPWFAMTLFWCHLITIGVSKIKPGYVITLSLLTAVLSGYATDVTSFLAINRTIYYFPFFYVGYLLDIETVSGFLNKLWVKIISCFVIVGSLSLTLILNNRVLSWVFLFKGNTSFSDIDTDIDAIWGGVWRITAYVIAAALMLSIIAIVPNKRIVLLTTVGRRTLAIYAIHIPLMIVLFSKRFMIIKWLVSGHIAWHCLLLAIAVVLFLSIPVFDAGLRKMMVAPKKEPVF